MIEGYKYLSRFLGISVASTIIDRFDGTTAYTRDRVIVCSALGFE